MGLKNHCSSSGGGQRGDAIPGLRCHAALPASPAPAAPPAAPGASSPAPGSKLFPPPAPPAGVGGSPGLSGERRPGGGRRSIPGRGSRRGGRGERGAGRAGVEARLPAGGAGTCRALGFPDHPFPSPPAHLPASLPPRLPSSLPPSPPELKLGQSRSGDGCEPTPLLPARSAPSPGRPESAPPPASPGGMLLRELLGLLRCCWPSLLLHCALHPLWGSVQVTQGEPQKSCSKPVAEKVTESCQQICQCRPPPPLPPPPPPPPPPRLLVVPITSS
ncbi:proline-rich membrane anchor 1 isoform X4 [Harpia harpyja]|uniref:proline-rich membrane anchor 1 isoform X4 n=1 Tax=Harpia harpyja TaxID=202280 RepID=UPI0022B1C1EE|nr:proline-rich membrane anchor 1 isoform X4 [Harpia harpyja]